MKRLLLPLCFLFGLGTALAGPYLIPAARVAQAVLAAHPELAGDAVELPAPVAAKLPAPVLQAGPLERTDARTGVGRVRLQCREQGACLPFYATVRLSGLEPSHGPGENFAVPVNAQTDNSAPLPATAHTIRSGQRISMLIDSGYLHLCLSVTSLQAGSVGNTIRVAGAGRGRIYQASVLDASTVRGSL